MTTTIGKALLIAAFLVAASCKPVDLHAYIDTSVYRDILVCTGPSVSLFDSLTLYTHVHEIRFVDADLTASRTKDWRSVLQRDVSINVLFENMNKDRIERMLELFVGVNIKGIVFVNNRLRSLPVGLLKMKQLRNLAVKYNNAVMSLEVLQYMSALRELWIESTSTVLLPKRYLNKFALDTLVFRVDSLQTVPINVASIPIIRSFCLVADSLWCLYNKSVLQSIMSRISKHTELEELSLNLYIDSVYFELPTENISELNIVGHNITEIPHQIHEMKKLEVLRMPLNKISRFPCDVTKMSSLKHVSLVYNRITTISEPQCVVNTSVTDLDLRYNRISEAVVCQLKNLFPIAEIEW